MNRSTSRFCIAMAFVGFLASVPVGAAAQELSSTLDEASMTPHRWTPGAAEVAPQSSLAHVRSSRAEDGAGSGFRIGTADVLLAIGGVLVAGALTDYLMDAPHWSLTPTQAGVFGGGALVAALGGLYSDGEPNPSGEVRTRR